MLKFLIVSTLITVMSGTTMAQMIPEKCQKLRLTDYILNTPDPYSKNLNFDVSIHNDSSYRLTFATFSFDLLIDNDVKVGEATTSIGRLGSGETWKVVHIFTLVKEIKFFRLAGVTCHFSD